MTLPDDIEAVALLGWHVFPRSRRSRAAAFKGAHEGATHDLTQLAAWARDYRDCGWQAVCGPSGIWCLDVDQHDDVDGVATLRALIEQHGPLPPRPTVRTPRGWLLVFAAAPHPLRGAPGCLGAGIDPRRERHSITLPPSRHHTLPARYRWVTPPWQVTPPPAPAWLLALLRPPPEAPHRHRDPHSFTDEQTRAAVYRCYDRLIATREGGRNAMLNRSAFRMGHLVGPHLSVADATDMLLSGAKAIGLPHTEAIATIRSGLRAAGKA